MENKDNIQEDYCQFLLSSHINFTQTYFADHSQKWSHDQINRYLGRERITPRQVWENVSQEVVFSAQGYLLFDDTVADKPHAWQIEMVRRQWSGNHKRVVKGIGVVTCVYVNPEISRFWIIDFRLYDPERDGKSKLDHVREMLLGCVYQKELPFQTVLMDSWYATRPLMLLIERLAKIYYCPLKSNRNVDDTDGQAKHQRVDKLDWDSQEEKQGKLIHVKDFPKGHRVKLFRLVLSTKRTDYVITNDLSQDDTSATRDECGIRWQIEQFHRETKQVTGLEHCQCRKQRAQRNHIACAILVWVQLNRLAHQLSQNVYQLKQGLLSDYLRQELRNPSLKVSLA